MPLPRRAWPGGEVTQPRGMAIYPDRSGMLVASARTSTSSVVWAAPQRLFCCSPAASSAPNASVALLATCPAAAAAETTSSRINSAVAHPYGVAISPASGKIYISNQVRLPAQAAALRRT